MELKKFMLIKKENIVHSGYYLEEKFKKTSDNKIIPEEDIKILTEPPILIPQEIACYKTDPGSRFRPYIKMKVEIGLDANALLLGQKDWVSGDGYYSALYAASYCKVKNLK